MSDTPKTPSQLWDDFQLRCLQNFTPEGHTAAKRMFWAGMFASYTSLATAMDSGDEQCVADYFTTAQGELIQHLQELQAEKAG